MATLGEEVGLAHAPLDDNSSSVPREEASTEGLHRWGRMNTLKCAIPLARTWAPACRCRAGCSDRWLSRPRRGRGYVALPYTSPLWSQPHARHEGLTIEEVVVDAVAFAFSVGVVALTLK